MRSSTRWSRTSTAGAPRSPRSVPDPAQRAAASTPQSASARAAPGARTLAALAVLAAGRVARWSIALAATVLPVWQKREYVIALDALADRARAQAAVSETLRAELERQVNDYNFALERKFGYPADRAGDRRRVAHHAGRHLAHAVRAAHDARQGSRARALAARRIRQRGPARDACSRTRSLFTQAAPRSPTTKIQPGPGEIFDVAAQLKPQPAPASAPLVIASGSVLRARPHRCRRLQRRPARPPGAQPTRLPPRRMRRAHRPVHRRAHQAAHRQCPRERTDERTAERTRFAHRESQSAGAARESPAPASAPPGAPPSAPAGAAAPGATPSAPANAGAPQRPRRNRGRSSRDGRGRCPAR